MSEPQDNPIRDLNNARNLPRETVGVSKKIGKLAAEWKYGDINPAEFAVKAQAELNKMADVEEERDRYRKALYSTAMRIVNTDNFGGDYPDESFIFGPMTSEAAQEICSALNKHFSGELAPRYWKVVPNDYKLIGGFEP